MYSAPLRRFVLGISILLTSYVCALAQTRYVVTNDDSVYPFGTGVSFYTAGAEGKLTLQQQVQTGNYGIGGGYFGANRIAVLKGKSQKCVYASQANNGEIVGIDVDTLTVGGTASGSPTDTGASNGIGLAIAGDYLYASFTDVNTIGVFEIQPGCSLMFVNDTAVSGLNGGVINAMATHGHMLIASFTDGSIESFDISSGTLISNRDEQFSTATLRSNDATYPNQIEITKDGHYAIFGSTSTAVVLEVSDVSSGKLRKTEVFRSAHSISSSNIKLSPDESILYVVNTQGDAVSAFFFDKKSGVLTYGCTSDAIQGQSKKWSYLASAALVNGHGDGGGVYVAEFGGKSGIALVKFQSGDGTCTLQEAKASPFHDTNSTGLLSIDIVPK